MKKYFKTYTKKSLALLMTVMMLMSCWVFVAPTKAEAAYGDVTIKIKYTFDSSATSGGNIKVSYYPFKSDGTGIDKSNSSEKTIVDSFKNNLEKGDDLTVEYTIPGFPYQIVISDESASGCDAVDKAFVLKGFWINGISCTTSGFDKSEVSNTTKTYKYDGTGNDVTVKWDLPSINSVSLSPTTATVNIPRTGSASTSFTATVKDQYGCTYYTLGANSGSCSISPANSGISYGISDNTVTVSAKEAALASLGDYNSTTGKGTETVTVSCNSKTASATITYVSPDYTVKFASSKTDADNSWSHSETTKYKGSVTYNCESSKILYDKTGHYTFQCWHEGNVNAPLGTSTTITINNVTDDRTITAQYSTSEPHNSQGGYNTNTTNNTHQTICSVCQYVNDSVACSFGNWTTSGSSHVRSCACGNKQTHTPTWVDEAETKYLKSNATCTEAATYYKSCSTCGMQGAETFTSGNASGHYYEEVSHEGHSCSKNAEVTYKCIYCGDIITSEYKHDYDGTKTNELYDKAGHLWLQNGTTNHTCDKPGYINYKCLYCDNTKQEVNTNDPAGHTWATTLSPIADTDNHGYVCTVCKKVYDDTRITSHSWTLVSIITAPTCMSEGSGNYKCNDCGATKQDTIAKDPNAHKLSNPVQNADGKTHTAICSNGCGNGAVTEACVDENKDCICDVCNGQLAHDFTKKDTKVDALKSAATCEADATYYYSCSVCGTVNKDDNKFFTAENTALGHDWQDTTKYKKADATCEVGTIYYKECDRCNISSKDKTNEIWTDSDALGHNFEATAGNAVDNKDGTHSYKCKNTGCSETGVGKVKDATESCTYGERYTINSDGTHTQTCTVCSHNKTEKHNYSAWSHIENKTADGKHQHQKKCVCGDIVTEACDMQETKTPATCLSVGKIGTKCSKCYFEETQDDPNAPQLEHSYTGDYVYDAKTNTHKRYCVNGCNELDPNATACTYEYAHVDGTNTHKATCKDCKGEKILNCHGGSATCIKKAVCDDCKAEYGDFAPHTFEGDAVNAGDGKHNYKCTTDGCATVGVDKVANATESCSGGIAYCDEKATCDKCHEKYGEFNTNKHKETNLEEMPGLAPTCMQPGYTNYQKCKSCGAERNKTTLGIDSTKHSFDGKAVSNGDGTHIVHCSNMNAEGTAQCSATKTVTCHCSEPTVTPPSCLDGGYQSNKCDDCGYEWTSDKTQPLGHDWGEWTYNEETGKHERVCKRDDTHTENGECKDSQTETIVNPTCTEQGYTLHTCTLCAHEWKTDYVDALGHDYSQKIPDADHEYTDKPKSCTNAQYYWFDCSRCDKNAKDEVDHEKYPLNSLYYENGDGKGHVWEGKDYKSEHAIIKTAATCTENAVYYVYCTACGASTKGLDDAATFVASGTAISHNYVTYNPAEGETAKEVYPASAATCTAKATYYKRCANCGAKGKETFEYGEKLQHTFTEKLSDTAHRITRATCSTKATYWFDCATCELSAEFADKTGMTEDQIAALKYADGDFDKNNHTAKNDVPVKNPTCLDDGHSAYEHCDACGADIGKVTKGYEKIAHSYTGAYVAVNEAAEDGTVTYKHKRACVYGCGNYSEVTACSFGDFSQDAEKTDGKFTHSKSCACGNKITQDCTSDATASCTQAVTCTVCHGTMQTAGGHKWSAWTSSGDGKTHYRVCENDPNHKETEACHGGTADGCGAIYCEVCSQAYAKGDNHSWGTWYEKTPATCTADQVKERECSSCHITETETGDKATGHKYDRVEETTPATCTKDGVMTYYCVNGTCKDSYTKPINKLGHELGEWITTTESTCKDEGVQTRYCKHSWKTTDGNEVKCDYFETQPIAADPSKHVPGEWQVVSGSGDCTSGIKYAKYCTKCNEVVDEKTEIIPHKWEADKVYNATCLENGYIEVKCLNCNATEVFDENTKGFPYKIDETTINPNDVLGLVAKGSHTWRTEAADGDTNYTVVNGCIVYITSPFSCADSGRGNRYCEVCSATESIVIPASGHDLKTIPGSPASCTVPGYQEYQACKNCPYQETPVKIPALGHEDTNGDGKCDRCYFKMYEDSSGNTSACGCICHSNSFFISKIIYPIARFFWKLFKINHDCSCGKTHY